MTESVSSTSTSVTTPVEKKRLWKRIINLSISYAKVSFIFINKKYFLK